MPHVHKNTTNKIKTFLIGKKLHINFSHILIKQKCGIQNEKLK